MKKYFRIIRAETIILFLLIIGIRFVFFQTEPDMITYPDSVGYAGIGNGIITNPTLSAIINPFRMPLYPIIIGISDFLFPDTGYIPVYIVQIVASTIAILFTYKTLIFIGIRKSFAFIGSCIIAIHPTILINERTLLTESLTTSLITVSYAAFFRLLYSRRISWAYLTALCSLLAISIRPSSVIFSAVLPLLYLGAHYFKSEKHKSIMRTVIVLCIPLFFTVLFACGNRVFHGYFGLQYVGEINLLGKIIQYNLPIKYSGNIRFQRALELYKTQTLDRNAYRFLDFIGFNYSNNDAMNELSSFSKTVVKNQLPLFLSQTSTMYPTTLLDTEFHTTARSAPSYAGSLIAWLYRAFYYVQIIWLVIPIGCFLSFIMIFLKRKNIRTWILFSGFFLLFIYTMQNAALGYEAYHRLNAPVSIIIFMMLTASGDALLRRRP